ncbi:MAG: hypothetical protein GY946_09835 [bacterium]|nr:hypothetical protein [bacterium]
MTSKRRMGTLAGAILAAATLFTVPTIARAHCDSLDGPVVTDARAALQASHVDRVLKWVSAEQEAAVREAFSSTLRVRALGDQARDLADKYFFETLVRLHRETEGAPYTGLRPAGAAVEAGVEEADRSIQARSADRLAGAVSTVVQNGIRRRFDRVIRLQRTAERSPADGRRYVAAYVDYIHYVRRVHLAATGNESHAH